MNQEPIKPNESDIFKKEFIERCIWKFHFKNSFIIFKLSFEHKDGYIITENKCKNMYDLRKLKGFLIQELESIQLENVN